MRTIQRKSSKGQSFKGQTQWFVFLCSFVSLFLCGESLPARAQSADSLPYSRRVWRNVDGLPEDFAQALAQTPDGYLWIGTSGGLVRFDGNSFVVFKRENVAAFQDDSVYSLLVTHDGTLWAGTEGGGLMRYQKGAFRAYGAAEGLTNGFVRAIFEDRQQRLWVGTDAGLFRMENDRLLRLDDRDNVPRMSVHTICEDRAGRLLFGGGGLLILHGTQTSYYTSSESQADRSIRTIRQTADGALWIGTVSGLRRIAANDNGDPFLRPKLFRQINISVIRESRNGQLWIGSYGQGLWRYQNGQVTKFTAPDLLPHNNILALYEDTEDNIWVGTQGGLLRLSPSVASTITTADGTPQSINSLYADARGELYAAGLNGQLLRVVNQTLVPVALPPAMRSVPIRNVFRDRHGVLWLGTDGQGIARIDGATVTRFTTRQGLRNDFTRAFCEDRDGSLWIGTDSGLSRFDGKGFQNFTTQEGLVYNSVRALWLDRGGSLWIATDGGLSQWRAGAFTREPVLESLRGRKVWALHEDADGGLWIGTHGDGLYWLKNNQLTQFTTKAGLPSNKIHFIAEDASGNLWMSGPSGILSVARRDLETPPASKQLAVRVYSTAEGLTTNQMNGGVQPAGALLASGELWFPSTRGAVRLKADGADRRSAPPILIEQVIADDHVEIFTDTLQLAPGLRKLEIHYTAIRLRSPDRLRFKYRMENFDPDWTEAGQRRVAYYTSLPAGKYRFQVIAYELDDPRNATEQSIPLALQPQFYKTAWFLALCGLAAAAIAWGAYRLHVRNLRQRFNAVLQERNRLAREMHDTLIQGAVGVSALLEAASSAQEISPAISAELLDRARNEVRATVDEARLAVWNLRQEPGEGFVSALAQLARRTEQESGIPIKYESLGTPQSLDAESERSLLMIIREALQNALRHAAPQHLMIWLHFSRSGLEVKIEDDGCGFDPARLYSSNGDHYGLLGMRERAEKMGGEFHLTSSHGNGTRVLLRIPLTKSTPSATK
ncbi:MAG TPA: two-component regulator propeller domain-containing protein [Blastocatellia bacterium]|nr:two-component regulator propeller domain-containing protein [Blastocatellia bacterium]